MVDALGSSASAVRMSTSRSSRARSRPPVEAGLGLHAQGGKPCLQFGVTAGLGLVGGGPHNCHRATSSAWAAASSSNVTALATMRSLAASRACRC